MSRAWIFGLATVALLDPGIGRAAGLLEPAFLGPDAYAETYTFLADLDDGGYVQVQLGVTNLGPGSGHGICRVLWVPAKGETFTAFERTAREAIAHETKAAGETLRVGPCRAVAGERLFVEAQVGGRTVRLRYHGPARAEVPPDSVVTVDGAEHRTELLLTGGRVTAAMEKSGRPALVSPGGGYADHSRSLVTPKSLAKVWVRFRSLRGDAGPRLLLAREARGGGFTPIWHRVDGTYRKGGSFALERNGTKREPGFTVRFDAGAGPLSVHSSRLLFRHVPLAELGVAGKLVGPLVGATLVEEGRPELPGILEVSLEEN